MDRYSMFDKYYLDSFYYDENRKTGLLGGIGLLFITFLLLVLGEIIGSILYGLILSIVKFKNDSMVFWGFLLELAITFGGIIIVILLFTKTIENLSFNTLGFNGKKPLKRFGTGFLIGFIMMAVSTIILITLGQVELKWIGFQNLSTILIIIPAWIIQSSTEELLTRGYLFTRLKNKTGNIYVALIIQGAFFSFLHIFNDSFSIIAFIQIFVVGILFAIYSLYEGSIWGACGMHAAWNWSQGNIFGWKVSGIDPQGGSLFQNIITGSDFLTGGKFGVEGGIVSLIVLIITIIIILVLMKNKLKNGEI